MVRAEREDVVFLAFMVRAEEERGWAVKRSW
jgi:hypothetical protein